MQLRLVRDVPTHRPLALLGTAAILAVVLTACTPPQGDRGPEATPTPVSTVTATPTSGATPSAEATGPALDGLPEDVEFEAGLPAGVTDVPAGAVAGAGWSSDGTLLYVTTFGSSSCPTVATGLEAEGSTLVVELTTASGVVCTRDFVPTTTTLHAPPDAALSASEAAATLGEAGDVVVPPMADPVAYGWVVQVEG